MKRIQVCNLIVLVMGLAGFSISSRAQSFIGFSQPICTQPMTNVYTYTNASSGMGSGTTYGFTVYKNGYAIYTAGGSGSTGRMCHGIAFINDSTGFITDRQFSGGVKVLKTKDYGATWSMIGQGGPSFMGMYPVNANYVYLVTQASSIFISRCSDLESPQNLFILDSNMNSDMYVLDTACHNSLCTIDSLNIIVKNGADTITYHINSLLPLMANSVNTKNCAGNTINVPYKIGSTFNPGNIFTAQLSDAVGSFVSPVDIGSVASTVGGTITAVIPPATIPGSVYKIRVVSTDPVYVGTNNGANISILNSPPSVTISSSSVDSIICVGSVVNLSVSVSDGSYTWSTGSTLAAINVTPSATTVYSLEAENSCGISASTISVVVDSTCSYVKPGDVNMDGVVNNLDVLELGLHFNQTGPPRSSISNSWQSYYAANWAGTITGGQNLSHSDCNGDGIINRNDTLAIFNNYTNTYVPFWSYPDPDLRIISDQTTIALDTWASASIYLGDSTNVINTVNGLAFSVSFMNSIDSIYLEYSNSFLNTANQNLNFCKIFPVPNGVVYAATTHTDNINVNGYGKIGTIHFRTTSTQMSPNQYISFWLKNAYKSNSSGQLAHLKEGACSFWVTDFVGVRELASTISISLAPNPTNGIITINSAEEIHNIEVTTITGQVLLNQPCRSKKTELQLQDLSNGIYFVKAILPDGRNAVKRVVLNH